MQIRKSINTFCADGFALKYCLPFEIYAPEIYEMFVYKHAETIEYVKK